MSEAVGARAQLYIDQAMDGVEERLLAHGRAVVHSSRSPGKATPNEDAAALIPLGESAAVLAVADGLGGVRGGDRASELAVRALAKAVRERDEGQPSLRAAILDAFESANRAVLKLGVGAATTLSVLELRDGVARPYHVGDSMVLIVGQRGRIKLQTVSHSPVGFAVAAGLLDDEEAMHHEQRHVVSNVLGAADMRIDVGSSVRLAARDTVLLASDGLLDNLHGDEIVECIRKGPLAHSARHLADDARRRMTAPAAGEPSKPDDLTFVAYRRG